MTRSRRPAARPAGVVAALVVGAAAAGAVAVAAARTPPAPQTAGEDPVATAAVERGKLAAMVSAHGTLTHRARPDGSPYPVVDRARGTYTQLPEAGAGIGCGDVLYRVDDRPVLLLCGDLPAYRDLREGDEGNDVQQLNANLHQLGDDTATGVAIAPDDHAFTASTTLALTRLQQDRGVDATGALALGDAVVLPGPARIATVAAVLGAPAQPGATVLSATSDELEVQVDLDPSARDDVAPGDLATITLPGNTSAGGRVARVGTVAREPDDPRGDAGLAAATIPAFITLDDPTAARGLDRASVRVDLATRGVDDALHVPVTAIVGRSGGGYAVEVVRDGGRRELVTVELGLFDTTAGRVQVDGEVRAGDRVVVPSS